MRARSTGGYDWTDPDDLPPRAVAEPLTPEIAEVLFRTFKDMWQRGLLPAITTTADINALADKYTRDVAARAAAPSVESTTTAMDKLLGDVERKHRKSGDLALVEAQLVAVLDFINEHAALDAARAAAPAGDGVAGLRDDVTYVIECMTRTRRQDWDDDEIVNLAALLDS